MNIRVIVSGAPGVVHAEDHKDVDGIGKMSNEELAAWVRGVVIAALARGPAVTKRSASR